MALARNILPPFHNKSVKGLGILERLVSENVHVFAIPMGATGHTCAFLSQLYRPHQLYLLPSGPLSALALFGRATTVIVIATL